jgi:hypothetical protein
LRLRALQRRGRTVEPGRIQLLVVGAGLVHAPGRLATEEDAVPDFPVYPRVSEPLALSFADRGVRVWVVRPPSSVHGQGDYAFVPALIGIAGPKACRPMSAMDPTAGPPCTDWTRLVCSGWRWRLPHRQPAIRSRR